MLWLDGTTMSHDTSVLRGVEDPFDADGGLKTLAGNLGSSVIKTSAVKPEHRVDHRTRRRLRRPGRLPRRIRGGHVDGDLVAVLRYQGPRAIGMPELHKLTPALGVLQDRGHQVALVTDGRMSGASGKVPAAIHLTPEAATGGPLARVRDGDIITVDAVAGTLTVHVPDDEFAARAPTGRAPSATEMAGHGTRTVRQHARRRRTRRPGRQHLPRLRRMTLPGATR